MSLTKDGFYKQIGGVIGDNNYLLQAGGGAKAWGNASGNIPVSNGTVNTDLNADTLDGYHKTDLIGQLTKGSWNPRGTNLAMDWYYNGGDMSISETNGQISVSIDGYFYQNEGQYRVLDENNYPNYVDSRYVLKTGDTMVGTPYINMPASAASISNNQPFGITYGRIQGYGDIFINADTDGSTSEYVHITAGYGASTSGINNGLAVGYNNLYWKGGVLFANTSNVGIGTTSPSYKLDVRGDISIGGQNTSGKIGGQYSSNDTNMYNYITFFGSNSNGDIIYTAGKWTGGDHIGHLFKVYGGSGNNDIDALTIRTITGNIGINTTSPTTKLDIRGTDKISMSMDANNNYRFSPSFKGTVHLAHATHGSGAGINDGYIDGITFGVGTAAYAGIFVQNSGSYGSRIIFTTTDDYNYNKGRMILDATGKLGIGTMTPDHKLTIANVEHGISTYYNFNYHPCYTDGAGRPGLSISGRYPYIWLTGGAAGNTSHGATITLAATDSGSSGSFKGWTFGVPGQNATWMDLGYGSHNNPHYHGQDGYTSGWSGRIMRFQPHKITIWGTGNDCDPTLHVVSSRNGSWTYGAGFMAPNLSGGNNIYVPVGAAMSTRNCIGLTHYHYGSGSTSNYAAMEIWGIGNIQRWYYGDMRTWFAGRVDASGFYHNSYGSYDYLLTSNGDARHMNTLTVSNSDMLDGYHHDRFQVRHWTTQRDFGSGTLIYTDINYANWSGDPFYGVISGNTYGRIGSTYTTFQGYLWDDGIINYSVSNLGIESIGDIIAMNISGNLCFWFPRQSYWEGYSVEVYSAYDYRVNRVTNVTDSGDPGGSKRVNLNNNTYYNFHNGNSFWADQPVRNYSTGWTSPWFDWANIHSWCNIESGGVYFNGRYGAHFQPNDWSSYGQFIIRGSKNGYSGIHFGESSHYMTLMDNYTDKGIYQQDQRWILYYNANNGKVSLRDSADYQGDINLCGLMSSTNYRLYGYAYSVNCNDIYYTGIHYYTSNGPSGLGNTTSDGALYSQAYDSSWVAQIAQDYRNGHLFIRGKNAGSWTAWDRVISRRNSDGVYFDVGGLYAHTNIYAIRINGSGGIWNMLSADISVRSWSEIEGCNIQVSGVHWSGVSWNQCKAIATSTNYWGFFTRNLAVWLYSDGSNDYIFIQNAAANASYCTLCVNNILYGDTAASYNLQNIDIYGTNSIPSGSIKCELSVIGQSGSSIIIGGTNSWFTSDTSKAMLQLGSSGYSASDRAIVGVTDGNLHIDAYPSHALYLNYYNNNNIYLQGGSYWINTSGQSNMSMAHLLINGATWWSNWYWSGQSGQPTWIWGSNDGTNMYVWNPSNFNVYSAAYIRSMGDATIVTGRNFHYDGAYTYRSYNWAANSPMQYGAYIGFGHGSYGSAEIGVEWTGNHGIWYRSAGDWQDWSAWRRIYDDEYHPYADYAGYLTHLTRTTRSSYNSSNSLIESVTGYETSNKSFIQIWGFAPTSVYRTSEDRPAPYGIGFTDGSDSGGIMPVGDSNYLAEIRFYGANSGPTYFTFGTQVWESSSYLSNYSNRYETHAWIHSQTGQINTDNSFTLQGYAPTIYSSTRSISGYAGEIYFGGNLHMDSTRGYSLYLNWSSSTNISMVGGGGRVGIGTDGPGYKLDIRGTTRSTDRIYANEWIQFDNWTGLYSPNNGAHFYPNNTTSYGAWQLRGSRNGYGGIHFGDSTHYMTLMDDYTNKGIYQQDQRWILYYNANNGCVSLRDSGNWTDISLWGSTYISGTLYTSGGHVRTDYWSSDWLFRSDGGMFYWPGAYDGRYVLKSGDSMTGTLSVCSASENAYPNYAAIEVRERSRGTTSITHNYANAPRIGFHWGDRYWANLVLYDSWFRFMGADCNSYYGVISSGFYHSGYGSSNYFLTSDGGARYWPDLYDGRYYRHFYNENISMGSLWNGYGTGMSTQLGPTGNWWHIFSSGWSDSTWWISQIAVPTADGWDSNHMMYRTYHGSDYGWRTLLDNLGGWISWNYPIRFEGPNQSVYARLQYSSTSISGFTMHGGSQSYAFYIDSNGYSGAGDTGGLAIDNDGVTVFGAGDDGKVFRVLNEDNVSDGAQLQVTKSNGTFIRPRLSIGQNSVNTSYNLYVNGTAYFTGALWTGSTIYSYGFYHRSYGSSNYFLTSDGSARYWPDLYDGRYLRYEGWWSSGSGQNVDDAHGMIFAYGNHNRPGNWGIVATFEEYRGSSYRLQLGGDGWDNELYFRNRSSDRGGWHTGWHKVLHDGNTYVSGSWGWINGTRIDWTEGSDRTAHLLINGVTWWSNWYWSGQGGQPIWIWGSNDGTNMYVWNPSNFSVNYANSANAANYLACQGTISHYTGTSRYGTGLRFGRVYANSYPFNYGSVLTMETSAPNFGAQIAFDGKGGGGNTGTGNVWYRTHSDWSDAEWGQWRILNVPIGTIVMWAASTPPEGWLICNGSTFSSSDYPELYSVLGTTTLPDLRARVPIGVGESSSNTYHGYGQYEGYIYIRLLERGGSPKHTLTLGEMPTHRHYYTDDINAYNAGWGTSKVADISWNISASGGGSGAIYETSAAGSGISHYIMQPYTGVNFIIKAK